MQVADPTCKFVETKVNTTIGVSPMAFISNIERFTIKIDHTMNVPEAEISKRAVEMQGRMVIEDSVDETLDPCDEYFKWGFSCPPYIGIKSVGHSDIISVASILRATGIDDLLDGKFI